MNALLDEIYLSFLALIL